MFHREPLSRSRIGCTAPSLRGVSACDTVPRGIPCHVKHRDAWDTHRHLQHLERNVARRYARGQRVASGRVREDAALAPHLPAAAGGCRIHSIEFGLCSVPHSAAPEHAML
jgi:hypothetical protein